jgi:hypothetical protein
MDSKWRQKCSSLYPLHMCLGRGESGLERHEPTRMYVCMYVRVAAQKGSSRHEQDRNFWAKVKIR